MNSKEWKDVKLKDITILISRGITPKYTDSEGVIVINQKCIRNGQINLKESRLTDDKTKKISENKFVDNNDILICSTGIGTLGRVGFLRNKLNTKLTVDSHVSIVRANKDYTNPIFLGYNLFLRQSEIEAMAKGSTGQTELSRIDLGEMNISLPPLEIQEKIASILSSLDDKIELNNKINQNLEQQAQAIFKSWFVDFEPFDGKMPDDWKIGTISELGTVVGGSTPSKKNPEYYTNNGIAWITPKDLSRKNLKFISKGEIDITDKGFKNSSVTIMPKGTVLFSSRAPIGYISIAQNDVTTNQGFKSVIPFQTVGTPYVYLYLKNNITLIENMAAGSTFKEVSGSIMQNIPALIPSKKILKRFNTLCDKIFRKQEYLEVENEKLTQLRDTLLPKLMSGEIDVDKVEI